MPGSTTPKGRNAIEELAHHVLAAQKLTDYARGTTVNVGVIRGGTRANVVPEEAHALIDFRVTTMEESDRLERWVSSLTPVIPGTAVSAALTLNRPPMPRDATMAQALQKAQAIARQIGLELHRRQHRRRLGCELRRPAGHPRAGWPGRRRRWRALGARICPAQFAGRARRAAGGLAAKLVNLDSARGFCSIRS